MPTAAPNGVDLYYERHGERGEPLVLVHGFTGDITDWRFQVAEFARTHRVLIADNRGHGRSSAPADLSHITIERMADDIEALARMAGFERYHLLGHSMGGAIAQEIAVRDRGRLLSLTLEDTAPSFAEFRPRMPEKPPPLSPERLEEVMARLARMSPEVLQAGWKALAGWQGTLERATRIPVRTLVIYGEDDGPALVDGSRRLAELIPNSKLHVVEGGAHCPQEERPDEFNAVLRAFLEARAS